MLGVAGSNLTISNLSQQHPTFHKRVTKRVQHVAPNNVAICCVEMLRSFGRDFTHTRVDECGESVGTNGVPRFHELYEVSLVEKNIPIFLPLYWECSCSLRETLKFFKIT